MNPEFTFLLELKNLNYAPWIISKLKFIGIGIGSLKLYTNIVSEEKNKYIC